MKPFALWVPWLVILAGCTTAPAHGVAPTFGDGSLEVTLYEDYQCPHCRDYTLSTAFEHLLGYADNGTITLRVEHVAFVGPLSEPAAVTSRCVAALAMDAWIAWDRDVFMLLDAGGQPDRALLTEVANQHGIASRELHACEDQPRAAAAIRDNTATFSSYGQGTPALVIDGAAYNPNDVEAVDAAIQAAT